MSLAWAEEREGVGLREFSTLLSVGDIFSALDLGLWRDEGQDEARAEGSPKELIFYIP